VPRGFAPGFPRMSECGTVHIAELLLPGAAFCAGWVDSVVGGGGLIQLPVLLLAFPAMPVTTAMGTNKFASVFGTASAALTYGRRIRHDWRVLAPTALVAALSAAGGALAASRVSSAALRPIILGVLGAVALLVVARPSLGRDRSGTAPAPSRARRIAAVVLCGGVIGFYDGMIGPGTGTFLILSASALLGLDFVHASATAKVVNAGTNLGALLVFAPLGRVMVGLGLAMAVCNTAGSWVGARTALKRGTRFVRIVLLCVVGALIVKLAFAS
jgi:uncharacterized membrane protein YfcA